MAFIRLKLYLAVCESASELKAEINQTEDWAKNRASKRQAMASSW